MFGRWPTVQFAPHIRRMLLKIIIFNESTICLRVVVDDSSPAEIVGVSQLLGKHFFISIACAVRVDLFGLLFNIESLMMGKTRNIYRSSGDSGFV